MLQSVRPLALALALVSSTAVAKGHETPTPRPDAAGVKEVFGVDGKNVRSWPDGAAGGKWNRKAKLGKEVLPITFSYGDVALAGSRVHENANPFTLADGVYTYAILLDGTTSFGHPLDSWEVGTRHAHLAHGRAVAAAGELLKHGKTIRLNLLSGTFTIPMIENQKVPNAKFFETRITRWFDEVLRARYGARDAKVVFETTGAGKYDNEVIFDVALKPPEAKEIKRLCADANFHKNNATAICKK